MSEAVRNDIEVRAVCPVTRGLPVRMTEHGFAQACAEALAQAHEAVKNSDGLPLAAVRLSRCLQCLGKERPPELQVVDLEILKTERGSAQCKRELEMGGKKHDGTCENCGRENMTLTRLHGDLVCTSCGNLFGAMANRPEAVEKALRKMLPHCLPAAGSVDEEKQELARRCDELAAEVQTLSGQLIEEQELRKKRAEEADQYWSFLLKIGESLDSGFDGACDVALVPEMVTETFSGLEAEKTTLLQNAERLTAESTVLANRVSELEKRLEDLEGWEKVPTSGLVMESSFEHDLIRDQLADFALKILQGQVGIVHREA
ncbi:hypothetical protein Despr_0208 [Desulfobulbus propionicus DSM 2032]|uniref:Uncharacterized protein n=1 Tax=Desulfobulbus propionicus (strain ATCC 33891 / DSM 2032 / VKM B-1956 / 1pr3) TaxID=577650 RepID=A0A7U4DMS9_DESPD|nr:TFIIB-type zinc ribbon-containing protein [Desulfobulbus propionicus]ADW16396.1 hypothetical protein Despr_0208 [Desulfobulbus propionicus DSM 2032]